MRIIIDLDESLTVGAHIVGVSKPTQAQAMALRALAYYADSYRKQLLDDGWGTGD